MLVVASINKFISLPLMVGILNLWRAGFECRMLLNEIIDSWREATMVKLVDSLNNLIPSLFSGKIPDWVKMAAFKSLVTEDSRHLKNALEFWMSRSSGRAMDAISTSASAMEW